MKKTISIFILLAVLFALSPECKADIVIDLTQDEEVIPDKKETPSITLDANGGTVEDEAKKEIVLDSSTTYYLPKPKRKSYIFNGWYDQKTGGTKIEDPVSIKSGTTLYAQWAKCEVKKAKITDVLKVSSNKKAVVLKKIKGTDEYEVQYGPTKAMKNMASSKTKIVRIKTKKKVYLRARLVRYDSTGEKVYGKWSKTVRK